MRLTRLFKISPAKAISLVALTALAIAVAIGFLADSNNASAQDIEGEHSTLSHITPVVWEGRGNGDDLSPAFNLSAGVVVVDIDYTNTSSGLLSELFQVDFTKTDGSDTHSVLLELITQGGTYSGALVFNVGSRFATLPPGSYYIEVQSEGSWHIDVSQPSRSVGLELPRYVQSSGDDGAFPYTFNAGVVPIYYEFTGPLPSSSGDIFEVYLYKMDGSERESILLDYFTQNNLPKSGVKLVTVNAGSPGDISPGVYMLAVEAKGAWRIALGARSFDGATPMPTSTRIPATATPSPTPTSVANADVRAEIAAIQSQVTSLQERMTALEGAVAALGNGMPQATPSPTPTSIPSLTPSPTPSPTPTTSPTPVASCIQVIDPGTTNGAWADNCISANAPDDGNAYYARFYTFTLVAAADVTITLSAAKPPYIYLLEGVGADGKVLHDAGDSSQTSQTIAASLQAGSYTIEAATWNPNITGDFTLTLDTGQ